MRVIVLSLREAREVNVRNNGDSMPVCLSICLTARFFYLPILIPIVLRKWMRINQQGKKFPTSVATGPLASVAH